MCVMCVGGEDGGGLEGGRGRGFTSGLWCWMRIGHTVRKARHGLINSFD